MKTVRDIVNVPATEFIGTINFAEGTCKFCGEKLFWSRVGVGREKHKEYYPCSCNLARLACEHNKYAEAIIDAEERESREIRMREESSEEPATISAEEFLCIASDRIVPRVSPRDAYDKVSKMLDKAGFVAGDDTCIKERVMAYAKQKGLDEALKQAVSEIELYISLPDVTWNTDVSKICEAICKKYNLTGNIL